MKCVSLYRCTLELSSDPVATDKESSLEDDYCEEDPECPCLWDTCIRILYSLDSSTRYLDHGEYEEDRDRESCHGLGLAMTVWMIGIGRFLRVADSEIDDR